MVQNVFSLFEFSDIILCYDALARFNAGIYLSTVSISIKSFWHHYTFSSLTFVDCTKEELYDIE